MVEKRDIGARILLQHRTGEGSRVSPIHFNELLGDRHQRKVQSGTTVVATLHGQIGERDQQRKFVGRGESPLLEDALDVGEESELGTLVWGRRYHFASVQ